MSIRNPKLFIFAFLACSCLAGWPSYAGTLVIPSRFVLQRPLNPALITTVPRLHGVAASTIIESFNSRAENNACDADILQECHETGLGLLAYSHAHEIYFQLEAITQIASDEGKAGVTKIRNRRDQQSYLGLVATTWNNIALGVALRNDQFEFRKRRSFQIGTNREGGNDVEWSLAFGATTHFWKWWHVSLYREDQIFRRVEDIQGRVLEKSISVGLYGLGSGAQFQLFEHGMVAVELYQLIQENPNERNELLGGGMDLAWKNVAAYGTFIVDLKENFFEFSGSRREATKYAAGVAWYGKNVQLQLGRDTRFFDGLDGGIKLTLGYQFHNFTMPEWFRSLITVEDS